MQEGLWFSDRCVRASLVASMYRLTGKCGLTMFEKLSTNMHHIIIINGTLKLMEEFAHTLYCVYKFQMSKVMYPVHRELQLSFELQ